MKEKISLTIKATRLFEKDLKLLKKQGRNLQKLECIITKLANHEPLELKYHDHKLTNCGEYMNCRELHIEPDWLLVYKVTNNELILMLIRTGSHSKLF